MKAADILLDYLEQETGIARWALECVIHDWHLEPIEQNGNTVGCFMELGTELHVAIAPEFRRKLNARAIIRKHLISRIQRNGCVTTRSRPHNHSFLSRLGFIKTGEQNGVYEYRIDHAKIR